MHLANAHAILPQNAKLLMGSTSIRLAEQVPGATGRDAREMAPASSLLLLFFFLFFFFGANLSPRNDIQTDKVPI